MKPSQLFRIPWYSAHRSLRWMAVVLLTACAGSAIGLGLFGSKPGHFAGAIFMFGVGLLFVWAFFLSTTLLLAIDAWQLRVPAIQRQIVASLLLHAGLGIAVPTLVLGMLGAPVLNTAVVLTLCTSLGLAFALMPRYCAIFFGLTPTLGNTLWHRLHLPGIDDPRFVLIALPLILLSLLLIVPCWRRLLRNGSSRAQGWSSPMVLQYRSGGWGQWRW